MARDVKKWTPENTAVTIDGRWKGEADIYGTLRQVLITPETPDTIYI